MPHQCVRCSKIYDDGANELLKGCPCGGRLFFYIRQEKLDAAKKFVLPDLTEGQREQVEKDVLKLIGSEEEETPVVLDFESVRILEPGKYQIDLVQLFKGEPLIFKLEEGKYVIDLVETFQSLRRKNKKK
jgi:hypothetical protein